jgi:glycosyltransferase involved in cell wall biosynthesis
MDCKMLRVYINPDYLGVPLHADNGGIRRCAEAQVEHLPKFGIQIVHHPAESDVICNHGSMLEKQQGVPSVCVNHGLYWSRQPWDDGFMEVNEKLMQSMHDADAWTAPSEWVSRAIRRGTYFYPEVVYHGVDPAQFKPSTQSGNYVLWNKARADYVSDPTDMRNVASIMPNVQFLSTIGIDSGNIKIIGVIPYEQMKQVVSEAGVYLATTRETFGIGTLEAMASGVPVAGWDWGGQNEIIKPGVTGYLAPPGDYPKLAECINQCLAERDRLSRNCVDDVFVNWTWEPRIEQYANIFKRVYDKRNTKNPKVSVIVTAYKLDQFLPACLDSVMRQTFTDFECLVVDDASLESTRMIVSDYAKRDDRIHYTPTPNNFGLPGARNYGLSLASGSYIRHLDADDFLADNALELEVAALETDRGIDIAYGHLEVVRTDGSQVIQNGQPVRGGWPEKDFNWYRQMAHLNQIPSCVMARREVFERSGGYRERMHRNEDAEFWCRVTSLGFRAKKFTQAVTYYHRERPDSKGAVEWATEGGEPDWTSWFPWRMGAGDYRTASDIFKKRGESHPSPYLVPFGAQGKAEKRFWYVNDYAYPVVSIIVTCGPGHEGYLLDALDSVQAQNYPDWECVVVNDTGAPWPPDIMGAPWAKVVNMDGNQGAAAARNEGFKHTKGRFIVWLDADDFWMPWFLERMIKYSEQNDGVIYSDFLQMKDDKTFTIYKYQDNFDSTKVPLTMQYSGSSVLVPRKIAEKIAWDEEIPGMEDWTHQVAVHDAGFCAYHIPEPLFVYRLYSSSKRETDYAKIEEIRAYMDKKWGAYRKGEKQLMCGCNSAKIPPAGKPVSFLTSSGNLDVAGNQITGDPSQMVMVEYVGPVEGTFSIRSRVSKNVTYRFGNNEYNKNKAVFLGDAEYLTGQIGREGIPLYRVLNAPTNSEGYDPVAFLGTPITA